MDMDLVPVYASEEGGAAVRVQPDVAQNLGVRLGHVERRALDASVEAVGAIAFDERRVALVQARAAGVVTRLHVKAPLTRVERGQSLIEILAPEWQAAQQEYLALLDAQAPSMQPIREAARQRLVVLGVPEAAIAQIERTRKPNVTTTLTAPISGVISELSVREGSAFDVGAPLIRINGLESVWANAQIPESAVALVREGASVTVRAPAWPGVDFTGRVLSVLPEVDRETRTLPVRVAIDNPDERLAPGMYASLTFSASDAEPQLVIPSEAVIASGARTVVVVARDGGYDVAEVEIGREANGYTTILSGLEEHQQIVLSGQFLIDSEANLRSAVDRLRGPAESEAAEQDEEVAEQAHH
jgi:Cu(I)/Ag(I) efflux system membrane fusion protein